MSGDKDYDAMAKSVFDIWLSRIPEKDRPLNNITCMQHIAKISDICDEIISPPLTDREKDTIYYKILIYINECEGLATEQVQVANTYAVTIGKNIADNLHDREEKGECVIS